MTMPMQYTETNVREFPHTPSEREKQHNQYQQEKYKSGVEAVSSSTTTVQKQPGFDKYARQSMAMEGLKRIFQDTFGREMPRAISEPLLRDIRSGTPAYYYRYAMEETLMAPRPSWRYTLAIVARLKRTMATEEDMDYRE